MVNGELLSDRQINESTPIPEECSVPIHGELPYLDPGDVGTQPSRIETVIRREKGKSSLNLVTFAVRKLVEIARNPEQKFIEYTNNRIRTISEENDHKLTVIQIGANDGEHNDPIRSYLQEFSWNAVLVEPNPHAFYELGKLYSSRPDTTLIEAAVTNYNGSTILHAVPFLTHGENPLKGKDSLHPEVLSSHAHLVNGLGLITRPIEVDAISVDRLLQTSNTRLIDGLVIDAEGHDKVILDQFLELGERPRFIFFEYINISDRDNNELLNRLYKEGYKITMGRRDVYAERVDGP